ncbi:death-inducer obliterator 1-like [Oryza brachyantha]|uniref:death-inducer obliterator 1-like n=1 Tax=Oryza brachyantha TaxID=4533 RepID=UPI001AD9550D|nr:death-inducer obliterator 1-like [Oryza brachyantha]
MELSNQGQTPMSTTMGSQPLPSSNIQPNQAEYPSMLYPSLPADWGAQPMFSMGASVPISSYYIVPMSQQSVQIGASRPDTPRSSGPQSLSRVSLRPPQQVLSIRTSLPTMAGSQPSPASKKLQSSVASPKVQMLKSTQSQSLNKRSAQKETPSRGQTQQLESVRSKFRESLSAALRTDSDHRNKNQSSENVQPDGSADQKKQVEVDTDPVSTTSQGVSSAKSEVLTSVDAERHEENKKLSNDLVSNTVTPTNADTQQQPENVSLQDDVLGQYTIVADELLQGHGLCWVSDFDAGISETSTQPNLKRSRTSDTDPSVADSLSESELKRMKSCNDDKAINKNNIIQKADDLAFRIEEELFKLFGGVNKKYKEKGRSLLFNLKDKSNPELRERVLSGDITPDRLCSMTAEELASKELSQWRIAKAEELAQMVVLPSTEVDVRRLVRKTHKGEFQVEVEETDGISVEVELGGNLLTQVPSKASEGRTKSEDKEGTDNKAGAQEKEKAPDGTSQDEDNVTGDKDLQDDSEYTDNEKSDLMQELMVDDLKDTENLPPIPSLDEFMQGLDSEPPFENLSVGTPEEDSEDRDEADTTVESEEFPEKEVKVSAPEKIGSEAELPSLQDKDKRESKLESPKHEVGSNLGPAELSEGKLIKSSPDRVDAKQTSAEKMLNHESAIHNKATTIPIIRESIWEGAIQLTMSSLTNVVAIFKSGEKPPVKEWRSFVEIKGRVKLSAFQEFVEQLPKSRSRAIMVTELCWKEGSQESGRQHLLQTIDSYVSDERVGLAEPAEGIELYLCPSQGKTVEILSRHLPKEHLESLVVPASSIIGVIVWRRPNIPRMSGHPRHDSSRRLSILKKPQVTGSTSGPRPSLPMNSLGAPPGFPVQRHHPHEEDVTDDVPPGFGPGVARDEDDLPEFNFVNSSNPAANVTTQAYKGRQHVHPSSARPVEQMRELVQKYGKRSSVQARPWDDDDDDDIPEWNPNQLNQQPTRQQQLPVAPTPPPPPPPPLQQMHPYQHQQQLFHQNAVQPQIPSNPLPQAYLRTTQQQPMQQLSLMQQQQQQLQPAQAWQQPNTWWPAQGGAATGAAAVGAVAPASMVQQSQYGVMPNSNNSVQGYGSGSVGGMAWRPR